MHQELSKSPLAMYKSRKDLRDDFHEIASRFVIPKIKESVDTLAQYESVNKGKLYHSFKMLTRQPRNIGTLGQFLVVNHLSIQIDGMEISGDELETKFEALWKDGALHGRIELYNSIPEFPFDYVKKMNRRVTIRRTSGWLSKIIDPKELVDGLVGLAMKAASTALQG